MTTETPGNLPALYAELERIGAEAAHWAEVEASDSTALVHVGSADPEKVREQMIEVRREARRKSKDLQAAADKVRAEVEAEMNRVRGEMQARMSAAMEALAPLREQVRRMEEGIWTVNLYLGTSEQIVTLREGAPARSDTPITLRTAVLAMDEETAAFPVVDGVEDVQGLDYRNIDLFDQWVAQPEALQQVLPEERGIVVLRPRRTDYHYDDDPLVNDEKNEANRHSYWLIRNGERLYRMDTDFRVGETLMPTSEEFTALFTETYVDWGEAGHPTKRREILPGTKAWEKAEKAQGRVQRHYMRVALILQGLIDRTDVFEPLPGAVNVMQQSAYDDGLVVVVNDAERTLHTSREPYYDWVRRLNAELRPGMRLMGNFRARAFHEAPYDWRLNRNDVSRNVRVSPPTAPFPASDVLHLIEDRRKHEGEMGVVIRYERTDKVRAPGARWWEDADQTPQRRASAIILPSDPFVIPFDLVTEEEMQAYLDARTERHAYKDSFPLLRAAIEAKRAEREAEAPFRGLLTSVLAGDHDQSIEQVEPHVDALVHRFKLGNRWHRPLVSLSQEDEAKALRLIRAEYARIVKSGADDDRDAHAVEVLREHDPSIIFIGRLSSGKYVAFAPMPREYGEEVVHPNLWVREHTTTKTAKTIKTRDWVIPGVRGNRMTPLFADERWTDWDRLSGAEHDLTDPEVAETMERVRAAALRALGDEEVLAIAHRRDKRRWTVWASNTDRRHGFIRRSGMAYATVDVRWRRTADGIAIEADRTGGDAFEFSYGGNEGFGPATHAFKRSVYMPWHRGHRATFGGGKGDDTHVAHATVVWEVDDERRAALVRQAREMRAEADRQYQRDQRVSASLRALNGAQVDEQAARIKADFLAEYPDEEMWEEHSAAKTKGLRPVVDFTRDSHHYDRGETVTLGGGATSTPLHPPANGAKPLGETIGAVADAGHAWTGLTIEGVYALADAPMPLAYEPVKHLVIPDVDPYA